MNCLNSCFGSDFIRIIICPSFEAGQQAQLDAASGSTHAAEVHCCRAQQATAGLAGAVKATTRRKESICECKFFTAFRYKANLLSGASPGLA